MPLDSPSVPWWVYAVVSYLRTHRGGSWLVWTCVLITAYCAPWSGVLQQRPALARLFVASDWHWFAIMAPLTLWCWAAVRWMDRNNAWRG